jgi:hypothetical protein
MLRSRWSRRLASLSASLMVMGVAAGCPPAPNSLSGSIESSHNLTFDRIELRFFTDQRAYQLDYLKNLEEGGNDVVAKIVFDEPEGGVVTGEDIDIAANNGIVERVTSAGDIFPPLQEGVFTFTSGGVDEGPAVGTFFTTFDSGQTLNGTFEGELDHVTIGE